MRRNILAAPALVFHHRRLRIRACPDLRGDVALPKGYGGSWHDRCKVVAKMKELPIDDFYNKGPVREDGRVMRPYYLLQAKKPSESRNPFDYLKLLATVLRKRRGR